MEFLRGPKVAEAMIKETANNYEYMGARVQADKIYLGKDATQPIDSALWNQKQLKLYQDKASGNFNEWEQKELDDMELNFDSAAQDFKSISNSYKRLMQRELQKKQYKERWIRQAKDQISYFMKHGHFR